MAVTADVGRVVGKLGIIGLLRLGMLMLGLLTLGLSGRIELVVVRDVVVVDDTTLEIGVKAVPATLPGT